MVDNFEAKKFELILNENQKSILNEVSENLKSHYNYLLSTCYDDYENNDSSLNLLKGKYNLRNYSLQVQRHKDKCKNYLTILIKNTALRLREAFERFFKKLSNKPKYKSKHSKWFSLYYDEVEKMPKFRRGGKFVVNLGKDLDGNKLSFDCKVKGLTKIPKNVKYAQIIKCELKNKFFLVYIIKSSILAPRKDKDKWISIDPNHKNMFMAVDYKGESMMIKKSLTLPYFNKQINILKGLRDKKTKGSRKYLKLQEVINKYNFKRNSQIKKELNVISKYLNKKYNYIIIGDYSANSTDYKKLNNSILTNSIIGKFRLSLGHASKKHSNQYAIVNESYTTMTCCITDIKTKRAPEVRDWMVGDRKVLRDLNSSVNIARRANIDVDISKTNLSSINISYHYDYRHGLISI